MKRILTAIGTWFRKTYVALRRFEEILDYRFEDYAVDRIKLLERRIAELERASMKQSGTIPQGGRRHLE